MHATRDLHGMSQAPHGNSRGELAKIVGGIAAAFRENVIHHSRVDLAGTHRIDADVVARMIERHAAGDLNHGPLAGAVGYVIGFAVQAPLGGDVDDRPLAGRLHVPDRRAAQIEQGVDVDRHGVQPLLVAGVERIGRMENAGIVDQNVQAAQTLDGVADEALAGACSAQIRRGELRTAARLPDGFSHGQAARLAAARHHDTGARFREDAGAGLADSGGRARDQYRLSSKAHRYLSAMRR